MRHRIFAKSGISLIVCGLIISIPATGQAPAARKAQSQSRGKNAVTKKWRTPWGDPDLQGPWSNTNLPTLERPAKYGGREFMTTQERAEEEAKRTQGEKGSFYDPSYADGRTSLIYDPPDGKIPALTPEGKKRKADESLRGDGPYDGPEDIDLNTRCIIRDPLPRIPRNYANSYEIVQAPGFVAIYQEGVHETRIIPLDGRPHIDQSVCEWLGDSRGHWEGDPGHILR